MRHKLDSSGINSLNGFAYQIKVFALYALEMRENMSLEFETIEDVNIKNEVQINCIDKYSQSLGFKIKNETINSAIQVKHTNIDNPTAQKIILNWLLLEHSEYAINRYILFTDKNYNNCGTIFNNDIDTFYNTIINSKKKSNAVISKVKKAYKGNFNYFKNAYNSIQKKYEFIDNENIDISIEHAASLPFRKEANSIVFFQRLRGFLDYLTSSILAAISKKKSYIMDYKAFICCLEDICKRYTETLTAISYSGYSKANKIDLKDNNIYNSREYIQLAACNKDEYFIKKHLTFGLYYQATASKYLENYNLCKVSDILTTTYDNFEDAKLDLQNDNNDNPYNRLSKTKDKSNSHADNEQIKYGSAIYLTKKDTEMQISWKDNIDEEN